jgi:hypothetical protein
MVAMISGCGEPSPTPKNGSAATAKTRSVPNVFPVTVSRTGGIAGFQDVLTVAGDGVVSLARKGKPQTRCQLTPATFQRLTSAAARLPWSRITAANTQPSFPDDMVTTMQSPAGGPVRVQDPLAGRTGEVFAELLSSLTNGPSSRRLCAPR